MPATISGGSFGGSLSSDPNKREDQQKVAGARLRKLQNEIDSGIRKKGSKEVREILNELEKKGIATFGTGLRGMFDVAGSGDKPYTRSQLGRLRGALYDPSQRDFSQGSQVAGQELTADDYKDYLAGREDRYKDSAFAKGIATLGSMFNPAGLATGALSAARAYGGKYLPDFLKEQGLSYANLLQYAPSPDISNQFAGIASLPVNQDGSRPTNDVRGGMVVDDFGKDFGKDFQLASNQVDFKPTIQQTAYGTINSQQMYPGLNYPTLNTLA